MIPDTHKHHHDTIVLISALSREDPGGVGEDVTTYKAGVDVKTIYGIEPDDLTTEATVLPEYEDLTTQYTNTTTRKSFSTNSPTYDV